MAGWLYRNLNKKVEKFIVSEPRLAGWELHKDLLRKSLRAPTPAIYCDMVIFAS